ncbi:unnamed protein product, partial [Rotaria sordida]
MPSLPSIQPKSDGIMNILLLGESGVGKSTFINAFVNYLKFNKLEEAVKNPIVLIPVSFIITTGDNFEEQLVKFEGKDNLSNEDHEHVGHSVTQHCKSKMSIGIIPNELYSLKQAQLKINLMIRPMLESMRNILRNFILWDIGSCKISIKLHPQIIKNPTAICLKCSCEYFQVAEFWFKIDSLHVFINNKCQICQCDPSDHYPIDYELVYKRSDDLLS